MSSLRDKILAAQDIQSEPVYIKEWGVTVDVKGLTGRQRAILLQDVVSARGKIDMQKLYPQLIVMSTFDPETGEPVFHAGDIDAIAEKSGAAQEAIAQVAMRLSGLKADETEKNSEATPSESSTSL